MRAGIATLQQLAKADTYGKTAENAARLAAGLREALSTSGIAGEVNATSSLATLFFADEPVRNYSGAKRSNTKRYGRFFREMLERGIFLAPSQFEAAFVSAAHTEADISRTLAAARESLQAIAADGTA